MVYVIANPTGEPAGAPVPPSYPRSPLLNAPLQSQDKVAQPSPINANNLEQKNQPRYNSSDSTLSTPALTSYPALVPTPPLRISGRRNIVLIDLAQGGDRDDHQNPLISRTENFAERIAAPLNDARRKLNGDGVPPAAGSVRAIYFDFLLGPPDIRVSSLPSTVIRLPPPKPRNLSRAWTRHRYS